MSTEEMPTFVFLDTYFHAESAQVIMDCPHVCVLGDIYPYLCIQVKSGA